MSQSDKFPSQLAERFQIRLPEGLRDRLKAAADENNRSMNSEIVARLIASLDRTKRFDDTIYVADQPIIFDEDIMESMMALFEKARKNHESKYGVVPLDQRKKVEGPFSVAPGPITFHDKELDSSQLRAVAMQLQKEALRLQDVASSREQEKGREDD